MEPITVFYIPLYNNRNQVVGHTIISPEDWDLARNHTWRLMKGGYAGFQRSINGIPTNFYLHRMILNLTNNELKSDHINHDRLDNRRCNLRAVSNQQNACNRRKTNKETSSKYIGVNFDSKRNKWRVRLNVDGQEIFIGYFNDEKEGALARDELAKQHHGEFANLNFP
jgi:hypothetical protein